VVAVEKEEYQIAIFTDRK